MFFVERPQLIFGGFRLRRVDFRQCLVQPHAAGHILTHRAFILERHADVHVEPLLATRLLDELGQALADLLVCHLGKTAEGLLLEQGAGGQVILGHGAELRVTLTTRHLQGAFIVAFDVAKFFLDDFV